MIGRAGTHCRDLVPTRLGGAAIASHIRIPDGGPVPDAVHVHRVGFQLIFCLQGWVDVGYQDQGRPLRLHPGDAAVQVARRGAGEPGWAVHDADVLFGSLVRGGLMLEGDGREPSALLDGDAFVILPGIATRWAEPSGDLEVLEVAPPGRFATRPAG